MLRHCLIVLCIVLLNCTEFDPLRSQFNKLGSKKRDGTDPSTIEYIAMAETLANLDRGRPSLSSVVREAKAL